MNRRSQTVVHSQFNFSDDLNSNVKDTHTEPLPLVSPTPPLDFLEVCGRLVRGVYRGGGPLSCLSPLRTHQGFSPRTSDVNMENRERWGTSQQLPPEGSGVSALPTKMLRHIRTHTHRFDPRMNGAYAQESDNFQLSRAPLSHRTFTSTHAGGGVHHGSVLLVRAGFMLLCKLSGGEYRLTSPLQKFN